MDSSDIWAVIIFAVSLALGFIGKKKELPQNPNVPEGNDLPEDFGAKYDEPWIYTEMETQADVPSSNGDAYVGVPNMVAEPYLNPENEGVSITSTPPPIVPRQFSANTTGTTAESLHAQAMCDDVYEIHDDAPQNNNDWRRAIIAYEILNRKY